MPTWTLRLVACAGFVALLSRLPALDSAADALVLGAVVGALALAAHFGPTVVRSLRAPHGRARLLHLSAQPVHPPRLPSAHGADA